MNNNRGERREKVVEPQKKLAEMVIGGKSKNKGILVISQGQGGRN